MHDNSSTSSYDNQYIDKFFVRSFKFYSKQKSSIPPKPHLDTTEIAAPNPDPSAKPTNINDFEAHFKRNSQRMARERRGAGSFSC